MMEIIMIMMSLLSLNIMICNHPMSMGLILILQTICIAMTLTLISKLPWFSYILFLIMIGGLLILFTYMNSLASNEKFLIDKTPMLLNILLLMLIMMMPKNTNPSSNNKEIMYSFMNNYEMLINKIFNANINQITLMLIMYLLVTLIMSVKITFFKNGPMRQKI